MHDQAVNGRNDIAASIAAASVSEPGLGWLGGHAGLVGMDGGQRSVNVRRMALTSVHTVRVA